MNSGDIEYCKKFYEFLLEHDIYAQVVHNHIHYPYLSDKHRCDIGPINHLFNWEKSPEGHEWWSALNRKLPTYFIHSGAPTIGEVFEYLLQAHTPQSYEYW